MQYRSNFKAEEARREKRKRKVSADESNRPPKKQKADPKAKHVAAEAEGTKKFKTKEQQKRLDVWLEYVETSQEELDTHEANIKYHGKFITPVTRETLKDAQHIVNTMQALCDLASDAIKESGECRDFPGFWDSMWDLRKELKEKTDALDRQGRGAKLASGYKIRMLRSKMKTNERNRLRGLGKRLMNWNKYLPAYLVRDQPGCAMDA